MKKILISRTNSGVGFSEIFAKEDTILSNVGEVIK